MKKLEPYLQPRTAAGLIIVFFVLSLMYLPLSVIVSERLLLGTIGVLFLKILFTLIEVFIWLTLGKFMRDELNVKYAEQLVWVIIALITSNLFLVESGLSQFVPQWLTMIVAMSKAGVFLVFGFLFYSILDYDIPRKNEFAISLIVLHLSSIGFVVFNGYPWHGVQLGLGIFHFLIQSAQAYYLYKIMIWAANFESGYSPVEKLIHEIGN